MDSGFELFVFFGVVEEHQGSISATLLSSILTGRFLF